MQDIAQARRDVFEERRNADKRVSEERNRSRQEIEILRTEMSGTIKKAERENDALITALGRLREENDSLRIENAILKVAKSNGHVETKPTEPEPAKGPLQTLMSQGPLFKKHDVEMVPPSGPTLGKVQLIDPTKPV
jgi:regulator of replication initiation timing